MTKSLYSVEYRISQFVVVDGQSRHLVVFLFMVIPQKTTFISFGLGISRKIFFKEKQKVNHFVVVLD